MYVYFKLANKNASLTVYGFVCLKKMGEELDTG